MEYLRTEVPCIVPSDKPTPLSHVPLRAVSAALPHRAPPHACPSSLLRQPEVAVGPGALHSATGSQGRGDRTPICLFQI